MVSFSGSASETRTGTSSLGVAGFSSGFGLAATFFLRLIFLTTFLILFIAGSALTAGSGGISF